jgi:hypothetical protein
MKIVYVLKCDTDGTMRSIPEPFGVALTKEEDAKRFATDFKNYGYKQSYEKLTIYKSLENALNKIEEDEININEIIEKKITEVEDYGWMTYEDKQTCIDILYELKEELCSKN